MSLNKSERIGIVYYCSFNELLKNEQCILLYIVVPASYLLVWAMFSIVVQVSYQTNEQ